jgi:uncharacterized repeat protein (TIGR03843 family)
LAATAIRPRSSISDLLATGELEIVGRLEDASNATFLCRVSTAVADDLDTWPEDDRPPSLLCVYKPVRGERPLVDFPAGTLARRERAAYLLSEATGWGIVPRTVLRDGPFGEGCVQEWLEIDESVDVVGLVVGADPRLRPICVFDVIANNADRKGGHLLALADGRVMGVDHGVCFATDDKLRTVLWSWRGQALSSDEMEVVERVRDSLDGALGVALGELLTRDEVAATRLRAAALGKSGRFPQPDPFRPALPWPPF